MSCIPLIGSDLLDCFVSSSSLSLEDEGDFLVLIAIECDQLNPYLK